MERELWPPLYRLVRETAKDFRQKYVHYQPWVLVAVMLWAALHDRPVSWACEPRHWSTTTLRPWVLPSGSTLSRRLDRAALGLFWRALGDRARGAGDPALIAFIDGKPLPVGGNSKDPDARFGRGAGCSKPSSKPLCKRMGAARPPSLMAVLKPSMATLRHGLKYCRSG